MNIEKLPSGKYRIRQTYDGQRYSVLVGHKPTKKEALQLINAEIARPFERSQMTFQEAADEYLRSRENVLSPSTMHGYTAILRRLPDDLKRTKLHLIDRPRLQRFVNDSARIHSPKTVRNEHGFIVAVMRFFYPDANVSARLPQKRPSAPVLPSEDDIRTVYDHLQPRFRTAYRLACYGLRRSEICALTPDDLNGCQLTISKAVVKDPENELHVKPAPKTASSFRTVIIDADLADQIRTDGVIFDGTPDALTRGLQRAVNASGVEHFSIHALRHYFASKAHALGIPEADILRMGGWQTDHVMKSHYRHALQQEPSAQLYASALGKIL